MVILGILATLEYIPPAFMDCLTSLSDPLIEFTSPSKQIGNGLPFPGKRVVVLMFLDNAAIRGSLSFFKWPAIIRTAMRETLTAIASHDKVSKD